MALPAFAAEPSAVLGRRCCWAPAAVSRYLLPAGAQQQTRRTPLLQSNDADSACQ